MVRVHLRAYPFLLAKISHHPLRLAPLAVCGHSSIRSLETVFVPEFVSYDVDGGVEGTVHGLVDLRRRRGEGEVEVEVRSSSLVAAWERWMEKGHESGMVAPTALLKEGFADRTVPLSPAAIIVRSYLASAVVQVRSHSCNLEMACDTRWTFVLEAED